MDTPLPKRWASHVPSPWYGQKDQRSEDLLKTPNPSCANTSEGKFGMGTCWLAPSLHCLPEGAHGSPTRAKCWVPSADPPCFPIFVGLGHLGFHAQLSCPHSCLALDSPVPTEAAALAALLCSPAAGPRKVSLRFSTSLQWRLFGVTHWWVIVCKSQLHSYS